MAAIEDLDDDVPEHLREEVDRMHDEQAANRSDREWFEDFLWAEPQRSRAKLVWAFRLLGTAGCRRTKLLSDLREIHELTLFSGSAASKRDAQRTVALGRKFALAVGRLEYSWLGDVVPRELGGLPLMTLIEQMEEKLSAAARRPSPTSRIHRVRKRLIAEVDAKVASRGVVGKRKADEAVALLLTGVTNQAHTASASRMARARRPKPESVKKRKPFALERTVKGGREQSRKRDEVVLPLHALEAIANTDKRRRGPRPVPY